MTTVAQLRARALRGAILLTVITLAMAGAAMWASLPVRGATLSGRHVAKHRRAPLLPPVRYRPNTSLDGTDRPLAGWAAWGALAVKRKIRSSTDLATAQNVISNVKPMIRKIDWRAGLGIEPSL